MKYFRWCGLQFEHKLLNLLQTAFTYRFHTIELYSTVLLHVFCKVSSLLDLHDTISHGFSEKYKTAKSVKSNQGFYVKVIRFRHKLSAFQEISLSCWGSQHHELSIIVLLLLHFSTIIDLYWNTESRQPFNLLQWTLMKWKVWSLFCETVHLTEFAAVLGVFTLQDQQAKTVEDYHCDVCVNSEW